MLNLSGAEPCYNVSQGENNLVIIESDLKHISHTALWAVTGPTEQSAHWAMRWGVMNVGTRGICQNFLHISLKLTPKLDLLLPDFSP